MTETAEVALDLQEGGRRRDEIARELARFCRTAGIAPAELEGIVAHMLEEGILFENGGIPGLGEEGGALYGAPNYLEPFSVFLSPPLFTIFHGNAELRPEPDVRRMRPPGPARRDGGAAERARTGRRSRRSGTAQHAHHAVNGMNGRSRPRDLRFTRLNTRLYR